MTVVLDTSVLVAGLVEAHPSHRAAFPWLRRVAAGEMQGAVAAHTVAETYAVLSTLPHRPRITPAASLQLIRANLSRFRIVALGVRDYELVVRMLAEASLAGEIVYDALIARAAAKGGAKRIVTLNTRDFERLEPLFGVKATAP
jgi:predicted nucleic acid-binding protein